MRQIIFYLRLPNAFIMS